MAKSYSVKKRVLLLLLFLLGMVLLILMYYNYFAVSELNKKTAEASSNTLYIQCQNMEKEMESIAAAMVNLTSEQVPFQRLAYGESGEYENYVNVFDTQQSVEDMMYSYSDWRCSVLISIPKGVNRMILNLGYSPGESGRLLQERLWEIAEDEENRPGNLWFPVKAGEESYLVRMLGYRSTWLFAVLPLDQMILMQNNDNANEAVTVFFDGNEIYTGNTIVQDTAELFKEHEGYYLMETGGKRYLAIESGLSGSSLKVAYLTPQSRFWDNIGPAHGLLILISFAMLFTLPLGYYLLRRMFFQPLDRLVDEMESLGGQENAVAGRPFREREFIAVDEAMHRMVDEISRLKIEKYEKELLATQVQLEYYRVQIRPHFYINCLKSIYSMIEAHRYQMIRKMIICLSNHLRYMLKEHRNLVPLREELNYIKNYIELQTISMQYPPECRIQCGPDMEDYPIPAVSLLSFVENSVKYSAHSGGPLKILVSASRLKMEQETLVCFSVSDNGQGFEKEVLVKLNALDETLTEEGHIGILNVVRRFRLGYGERAHFTFRNYEGAVNEIFLSEGTYEPADCG